MGRVARAWIGPLTAGLLLSMAPGLWASPPQEAQKGQQGTPAQQAPLKLEPVKNGFVVAPEVKFTRFAGEDRALVGVYGGWLHEGRFLLGAAGYTLTNESYDRELSYGGILVGYTVPVTRVLQVGVRSLFGGGEATLTDTRLMPDPRLPHILGQGSPHSWVYPWPSEPYLITHRDSFAVAEPQADLVLRLSDWLAVSGSAGYRLVAGTERWNKRLSGATGSVSIRIGTGF